MPRSCSADACTGGTERVGRGAEDDEDDEDEDENEDEDDKDKDGAFLVVPAVAEAFLAAGLAAPLVEALLAGLAAAGLAATGLAAELLLAFDAGVVVFAAAGFGFAAAGFIALPFTLGSFRSRESIVSSVVS